MVVLCLLFQILDKLPNTSKLEDPHQLVMEYNRIVKITGREYFATVSILNLQCFHRYEWSSIFFNFLKKILICIYYFITRKDIEYSGNKRKKMYEYFLNNSLDNRCQFLKNYFGNGIQKIVLQRKGKIIYTVVDIIDEDRLYMKIYYKSF